MQSSKFLGILEPAEADKFLKDWANLELPDVPHFLERYKAFFPAEIYGTRSELLSGKRSQSRVACAIGEVLIRHRDTLRKAWKAVDPFHKSWYLSQTMISFSIWLSMVRHKVPNLDKANRDMHDVLVAPPSQPSPIDAAILYLQVVIPDLAKFCWNEYCENPYFVGTKPWQKFCCDDCKHPSELAAKRKWWEAHGSKQHTKKNKRRAVTHVTQTR